MKAVIIGRNGQVAWELQQTAPKGTELFVLGRNEINVFDFDELNTKILSIKPDVIINASAYTAVDKAEDDKDAAYLLNETVVGYLAYISKTLTCRFIHVSTDFVFDGTKNTAYKVDDDTNPLSVYGASKLAGEQQIQSIYPDNSTIVRTSWVYSSHGNNFVKTMLRLMNERSELGIVSDQIGCPTYAKDLAAFLWALASQESIDQIYHWSDLGVASWYDFAVAINELANKRNLLSSVTEINPIISEQYPTPAKRPTMSLLDSMGVNAIKRKHWKTNLESMIMCLVD